MNTIPVIHLADEISAAKETFVSGHPFTKEELNPTNSHDELRCLDYYSKHYGPYHRSTIINNQIVSVQIYGEVAGYKKRSEIVTLSQGEGHKTRYGVWLCKDFIPIENTKEKFLDDANYSHYHVLVNSQVFELNADRSKISNMNTEEVQWVLRAAEEYIKEDICKDAKANYFSMKNEEDMLATLNEKVDEINTRINRYGSLPDIPIENFPFIKAPTNESGVVILFAVVLVLGIIKDYRIGEYSSISPTDMILEDDMGRLILAELEYKLSRVFTHQHPIETIDLLICWEVDVKINDCRQLAGKEVTLIEKDGKCYLTSSIKLIEVIELKKKINEIK